MSADVGAVPADECPNCVHPMSAHVELTDGEAGRYMCCSIDCKCIVKRLYAPVLGLREKSGAIMTNPTAGAVPAPGSDAAIKAGCTCPVLENAHGEGFSVTCDSDYCEISRAYYVKRNCPVHDPLSDLTMRPRTGAGGAADADAE